MLSLGAESVAGAQVHGDKGPPLQAWGLYGYSREEDRNMSSPPMCVRIGKAVWATSHEGLFFPHLDIFIKIQPSSSLHLGTPFYLMS